MQDTSNPDIFKIKKSFSVLILFLISILFPRGNHYQQADMHPTRPFYQALGNQTNKMIICFWEKN